MRQVLVLVHKVKWSNRQIINHPVVSPFITFPTQCIFSEPVPSPACVSWMCDPEVLWLRTISRHLMERYRLCNFTIDPQIP